MGWADRQSRTRLRGTPAPPPRRAILRPEGARRGGLPPWAQSEWPGYRRLQDLSANPP